MDINDDLVIAIRAAFHDSDTPPQGYPELRDYVLHGGSRPDDLDMWMAQQQRAQALVPELLERLEPATPGYIPEHHLEWWFRVLPYPWAEDLSVAVTVGFLHVA